MRHSEPHLQPPKPRASQRNAPRDTALRSSRRPTGRFYQHRGVILLLLGALVVWMNLTFVVPLVMGAIFAIVLSPLLMKMARWRIRLAWKALIITLGFAFSFLLPLGAVVFLAAQQALSQIQELQQRGFDASLLSPKSILSMLGLKPILTRLSQFSPALNGEIQQMSTRGLATAGTWLIGALQNLLATLPGALFSTFIIVLTLYYLLVDGRRAARFVLSNSIFGRQETEHIFRAIRSLCYSVVVASIAAGGVQALLVTISCILTGTRGSLLIGAISFMLSFLPMLGTAPVTLFLTAQALISGNYVAAGVFAVFVVVVGLSDNFVRPYVLKGGASLHPLVGFVAAFGALDAIGFYGVFIGPVVAGLFFTMLPMVARSYARAKSE